jgi:hypothetical protein
MLKAGDMSRPAPEILLTSEEKETLLRWMRSSKTEQHMVQRARVILLAASRSTLQGANFTSVRMLIEAIEAFVASWNQHAAPFEWTKAEVHQQQMKRYYSYLCK